MRILLRQAGLRRTDATATTGTTSTPTATAADSAVLGRTLQGDLPGSPGWLHVSDREDAEA
jgi:hypothetical protein